MNTIHNVVIRLANILNNFEQKVFLGNFRTRDLLYDKLSPTNRLTGVNGRIEFFKS